MIVEKISAVWGVYVLRQHPWDNLFDFATEGIWLIVSAKEWR